MDFSLTDEQTELVELAARILSDRATPERLAELEQGEGWLDERLWSELATAGILGLSLPSEHGGGDADFLETCLLLTEVGRRVAHAPVLAAIVLGALPLAAFGTSEQQARDLPDVAAGTALLTAALVEPGREDPLRPATTARRDGDAWVIEGTKTLVPIATLARRILVPAATSEAGVTVFCVPADADGLTIAPQEVLGGEPHGELTLDGVRVGEADVLGEVDAGEAILAWLLERALTGLAAIQLGVCEQALRMSAEYTTERMQFERPIATFQAVAHRVADAYIDVEAVRLSMLQAAWRIDEGLPAATEVEVAKWWASEAGHRVSHAAQHVHGGVGVDVEYPLHRYYERAKHIEFTLGSAAQQLRRIGARLAAEPA